MKKISLALIMCFILIFTTACSSGGSSAKPSHDNDWYLNNVVIPYGNLKYLDDWSDPADISGTVYFQFALQVNYNYFMSNHDWGERKELPPEYLNESMSAFVFPAEEIESAAMKYFDIDAELVKKSVLYMPELAGYLFMPGNSNEEWIPSVKDVVKNEDGTTSITVDYNSEPVKVNDNKIFLLATKVITIKEDGDSFKYVGVKTLYDYMTKYDEPQATVGESNTTSNENSDSSSK